MRPGVLHAGRQCHGLAFGERGIRDVDLVVGEIGADIRVERDFARLGCADAACGIAAAVGCQEIT